jgi:protease II
MTEINNQPIAPIAPVTDNYFGTDVVDNYRYMENFNAPTVQQWVKAQADYTIEQGKRTRFVTKEKWVFKSMLK